MPGKSPLKRIETKADSSEPDVALGTDLLPLVLAPDEWIRRRVEQIRFLDDRSYERRVSVDFEVPARPRVQPFLVPVALLRKEPMTTFDLRDEGGNSLCLLTKRENAHIAWSLLVAMGEIVLGDTLASAVQRELKVIAEEAEPVATQALDRFAKSDAGTVLLSDPGFERLAYDLVQNFLLLTSVTHDPGRRRVLKFSYVEGPIEATLSVEESLALSPLNIELEVPGIEFAGSYHLEVLAPENLEISSASLAAEHSAGSSEDRRFLFDGPSGYQRVHLYLSELPPPISGEAWIRLRPPRRGLVRQAALSALGTTALMLTFLYFLDNPLVGRAEVAAPLLLVVPGSISLFIAGPSEHAMRSVILERLRFLLVGLALMPYSGAVLLVVTPQSYARRLVWFALTAATAVLGGLVTAAWAFPRGRQST